MDVVVEVGDWEHECCGPAIERDQVVDLDCLRVVGDDGRVRLIETHHGDPADERIQGRVTELQVVQTGGTLRSVLRVPSGAALLGNVSSDEGHLEDPWTGEPVESDSHDFLVTVRVPGWRTLGPSSASRA